MRLAPAAVPLLLLAACTRPGGPPPRLDLTSTLTGFQEVPAGDLDGTGTARFEVDAESGRLCWTLTARGIAPATAAHIHRGEAGSVGPPVAPLTPPGANERSEGCAAIDPTLARQMIAQAHGFYVNVHNAEYPGGAIRGQLRGEARRRETERPGAARR